ncbi:hypothetical protein WICANDRAFT_28188, partial [Wickerhamomyces anomalus NRRL Y-366-8]
MASPSTANDFKLLGNTALKEKKYNEAIDHYTKAIELDSTDPIFYSNRAHVEIQIELYGAAIQDATKSI